MDYNSFLTHIYERHSTNVKLGLERMYDILHKVGNPERKLKGIHIAGTNGKGSTSAILESLLLSLGHTTGLNTSPHLVDYAERFRINGTEITHAELMELYSIYSEHFDETEASFFEITTALAFKLFVDKKIDSSIIEVGLGGRLDGTNLFNSTVTVITSISFDHTKTLGDTIEKIASEKAGIIKKKTPLVLGALPENALNVILNKAKIEDAPYYILNRDFFVKNVTSSVKGCTFDYCFPEYEIELNDLKLNLLGSHQANNASLALTALFVYLQFIKKEYKTTFNTSNSIAKTNMYSQNEFSKIRQALINVNWQGRLQVLSLDPIVVIDGAHNEEGVSVLIKNIKEIFPNYRYHFLVSILRDKALDKMIKEICSVAETIYISKNPSDRAADIQEQIDVAISTNTTYFADDDLIASVKKCISNVQNITINNEDSFSLKKDMIIITGSLYTIAEVLKIKDQLFPNHIK